MQTTSQKEKTPGDTPTPGFPSEEEQKEYWERKNREIALHENIIQCVDAFSEFLGDMNSAITKLRSKVEILSRMK